MFVATAAHPKQTLHNQPALIALGEAFHLLPHHTKPFRRRHVLFLLLTVGFVATMLVELSAVITRQSINPRSLLTHSSTQPVVNVNTVVRSSNGFALTFDNGQFSVRATGDGMNGAVSDADLKKGAAINSLLVTPLPSHVPAPEAAAELEITSEQDAGAFATFKSTSPAGQDIPAITANYFAPKSSDAATVALESRAPDTLASTPMTKSIYIVTPKFAGNPTRTIVWTTQIQNKPFAVTVRGIITGKDIPTSMVPILSSLKLSSNSKVQGISTLFTQPAPQVDQKYLADVVSPAIVKIYHIVCGSLVYRGVVLTSDTCSGESGSGFIVSSDGYIATSGHVVVYGAKDVLASALIDDHLLMSQYLRVNKLSDRQVAQVINQPELTASALSKVYDLPDSEVMLMNKRELTVAALGDTPLNIKDEATAKNLVDSFSSSDKLKRATIVGYNYSSKDQYAVAADPTKGFSASDVALLKVDAIDMPIVRLSDELPHQNQKISVFGFPGDADNQLTDNSKLAITVTNGSISAIREAAGDTGKLYQSDVAASHGSSGGPAVDETGAVVGIMTYRFASGDNTDAPKSYLRDITDFKNLVKKQSVILNTISKTQNNWEKGLGLFAKHHYSQALPLFKDIVNQYPAHRLVGDYIDQSEQAISDGKDVKEPPVLLLLFGTGIGLGGIALAVVLIARQHGHYRIYRAFHTHSLAIHGH